MKKILRYTGALLAALLALALFCLTLSVTSDGSFLPGFLPIEGYAVSGDAFPDLLPAGSLAIIRPGAPLEAGRIALLNDGTLGVADGQGQILTPTQPIGIRQADQARGPVVWRISGLGGLFSALRRHPAVLWTIWGLLLLGTALWCVTLPRRRRKREVRELIELFDYYGRKFDAEEEGIDY
ncbi:MAG: hypothetical protein PUB63_04370 [Clostridia bacterium]|nr:hypothetical protein [Clostridia bacterium]